MIGEPAANFLVARILRLPAGVADRGAVDARALPEQLLCAPEAAHAEDRLLHARGERRLERMAVDEMLVRHRHRGRASGQRALRGEQLAELLHEGKHRIPPTLE